MRLRPGSGPGRLACPPMVTPAPGRRGGVRLRTEVAMLKRIKAAVVPVVLVAAVAGAAGYRAQDSGSGRRLDELSRARRAAASHFPVDGAVIAASQAADVKRWVEGFQAHEAELFFQAVAANEAEQAAQAAAAANAKKKPAAPTGRGGSTGGGSILGGACWGRSNRTGTYNVRESGRKPNPRNASGPLGCQQTMAGTWSSCFSDLWSR